MTTTHPGFALWRTPDLDTEDQDAFSSGAVTVLLPRAPAGEEHPDAIWVRIWAGEEAPAAPLVTLTACRWHTNGHAVATLAEAREHIARQRIRYPRMCAVMGHELSMGERGDAGPPCCPAAAYARSLMAAAYREEASDV